MKLRSLLLALLFSTAALASDVKLSWNPIPPSTGCTPVKVNFYRVTVSGTESTNTVNTGQSANATDTFALDLNVASGTYFYKVSNVANCNAVIKESTLSNETMAIVPAAIIILNVPVQLPTQIIVH